jgi:hypothetical protein
MQQTSVWQKLDTMIGACKIFENKNYYHINSNCQAFEMPVITYERKLVTILKTKLVYNNMLKS